MEKTENAVDISVLFNEETSDETKEKVKTLFEAAVASAVSEQVEKHKAELDEEVEDRVRSAVAEIEGVLDEYFDYVAEQWLEENALAVESAMKVEMAESLLSGVIELVAEHRMEIPDGAEDVVEGLTVRNEEMRDRLNESHSKIIALESEIEMMKIDAVMEELTDGLPDTQAAKLEQLAEGIRFSDVADFAKKMATVKESFFKEKTEVEDPTVDKTGGIVEETKPAQKKTGDHFVDAINAAFAPKAS